MVYVKWLHSGDCEVWWELSRGRQGFINLSEREMGVEIEAQRVITQCRDDSLTLEWSASTIWSARAIYEACLACVSCNDEVKSVWVSIHPLCECLIPEQSCLTCHGPGISACRTNIWKGLLILSVRPSSSFQYKHCRARLFAQVVSNTSHGFGVLWLLGRLNEPWLYTHL